MRRALKTYGGSVALIVAFAGIAIVVGTYVVIHQRLQLPFAHRYTIAAEFDNSNALTPGLGQPAQVAGVKVGIINSATLKNGRSIVKMTIDPGKLKHVYANATASLHPNTPLADMQIDIAPGGPPAPMLRDGGTIPVTNTNVPIQNSDQFLSALDGDTREFFTALVEATGDGLRGRGPDLRALLRTLGPTSRQIRQLGDALVGRRTQLERLVHNLSVLAVAAGSKDKQLAQVVSAGDQTLSALAGQDAALREAIGRLPGTLSAAQSTLSHTTAFAGLLGPTLQALEPSARRLPGALSAAKPLLDVAEPVVRKQLRPFVRTLLPVVRDAAPATADFATIVPELSSSLQVFNYFINELSFNQGGAAQSSLKWIAWFAHNASSVVSTQDAHGPMIRGMAVVSCSSLAGQPALTPLVQLLSGTTPLCK